MYHDLLTGLERIQLIADELYVSEWVATRVFVFRTLPQHTKELEELLIKSKEPLNDWLEANTTWKRVYKSKQ